MRRAAHAFFLACDDRITKPTRLTEQPEQAPIRLDRDWPLTAGGLAARLNVTPQAAFALVKQLGAAGALREATGRTAWRGFAIT